MGIRIVNFITLDGVVQSVLSADEDRDGGFDAGGWVHPYLDDTIGQVMGEETTRASGMVLGRRTYDNFVASWSQASEDNPAVAAMNRMPKYLVSRSRAEGEWRNTTVISDVPVQLPPIVAATDGDLVVFGSSVLTKTLLQHRLVDQLVLLLFPLVLGSGKRMFTDDTRSKFRLTAAETSGTGVAILRYELER
jgi:dihydrofolate reductase